MHGRVEGIAAVLLLLTGCGSNDGSENRPAGAGDGSGGAPAMATKDPAPVGRTKPGAAGASATPEPSLDDTTAAGPSADPAAPDMPAPAEDPDPAAEQCAKELPSQPLRRLSSDEYHNTLLDLFGADLGRRLVDESRFPETRVSKGFSTDAEANIVNTAESNAIEDNAEHIATLIDADPVPYLQKLLPCQPQGAIADADIDACIDEFITTFGLHAYRRPLTDGETTLARRVYDESRAEGDARFAFAGLVQYFVQSPALLYRVERGRGGPNAALLKLDGYERATRLSYLLTGSMPDDELLDAAAADELATPEQVRAQALRLLDSDRFLETAVRFHRDWLGLHGLDYKEPDQFPDFEAASGALSEATDRFVRYVLQDGDGSIAQLLGGSTMPVNATLASYYAVDAPGASEDEWVPVTVPNRRGLITDGALMATLAKSDATRPIHRGGFVQTQFLCRELPALPANVDTQGPLMDTSMLPTARERLAPLMERGDCSTCHSIINPVGLAFEKYDAAGAFRDEENGSPIDAAGSLSLDGETVAFDGPLELADAIANSDEARDCYALFWYRAAMGRPEFSQDQCSLDRVRAGVAASGGDIRELILSLVQTDAFLMRRNEP